MSKHYKPEHRRIKRERIRIHSTAQEEASATNTTPVDDTFASEADTEFAAEVAGFPVSNAVTYTERNNSNSYASSLGTVAVIFAIVSFFLFPFWLGLSAAILGVMAYYQGSRIRAVAAIMLGVLAAMLRALLIAFIV
ncbi:5-bromo-4-chloroindolyl phosphate hydrolysis family protein [Paenibacillus sp. 481]|uniref:5-bromo-4-chloroindolyl phosphate hydrolysis family protein n=1 Tax=Paenibacillus sp. 481 TaxID=2835869 RepID=UPI001E510009|nr:5-bromo-4-chloroindolyl phosphate hydrolysis family protein [Paenibacillus sp. 481]UHA74151.1 hypothetical protein KIK04_03140 [Paenibacillus sp. 481]